MEIDFTGVGQADLRIEDPAYVVEALCDQSLLPDVSLARELLGDNLVLPLLLGLNGDAHTSHRYAVSRAMTKHACNSWEPVFRNEAADIARGLPHMGILAVGDRYARPLASRCVARYLGLEPQLSPQIVELAKAVLDPAKTFHRRVLSSARILDLFERHQFSGTSATTDMTNHGAEAQDVTAAAMALMTVGVELVARAIIAATNEFYVGTIQLPISDAEIDRVISDAQIVPSLNRRASSDTQIGFDNIAEGSCVHLLLPTHQTAHRTDQDNSADRRVPFGLGPHYCLGAAWVRVVLRAGLEILASARTETARVRVAWSEPGAIPGGPVEVLLW